MAVLVYIYHVLARLFSAFIVVAKYFGHFTAGFYILLALFIALIIAGNKIKIRILPKVLSYVSGILLILIFFVAYYQFGPPISAFFKKYESSSGSSTSTQKSNDKSSPSTKTTPKTTTPSQPTYQTPKQLYYSVSCSNCWNEGCAHNGYSYNGYDAYSYSYYRSLCQQCGCNDFKSQSFWK